jgi:MFS family permease
VRRIHYGWLVAAVTFLALLTSAGFRSTPGVLIVPLQDEFGWSRATFSLAVSINLVVFGLGGPFAAALHERFGVRRVMLAALALVSVGAALTIPPTPSAARTSASSSAGSSRPTSSARRSPRTWRAPRARGSGTARRRSWAQGCSASSQR